jgi:hypothetical protein
MVSSYTAAALFQFRRRIPVPLGNPSCNLVSVVSAAGAAGCVEVARDGITPLSCLFFISHP